MEVRRNLVYDEPLITEAVELLRTRGGSAHATDIASLILKISDLDGEQAALLVAELVKDDWRLSVRDDQTVELLCEDVESRLLHESDYVIVDVETTGAKTPPNRIMEVGAYRISQGRIVAEFQSLVNPQMGIPPFIVELTGITEEMVKGAPLFETVAPVWLDFIGDAVLVAHDAQFDMRFLNHEIARVFPGRRMVNSHLCTVKLLPRVFPGLLNYRLHTVAEHFQIPLTNRHRAGADALATAEIFLLMLARLREHGVLDVAAARRFRFNERAVEKMNSRGL